MEQSPSDLIASLEEQCHALDCVEYAFNDRLRARYENLSLATVDLIEQATHDACKKNESAVGEGDREQDQSAAKSLARLHGARYNPHSAVSKSVWAHSLIEHLRLQTMTRLRKFLHNAATAEYQKMGPVHCHGVPAAHTFASPALPTAQTSVFNDDASLTGAPTDHHHDVTADLLKHLALQADIFEREEKTALAGKPADKSADQSAAQESDTDDDHKDELISLQEMLEQLKRTTPDQPDPSSAGQTLPGHDPHKNDGRGPP